MARIRETFEGVFLVSPVNAGNLLKGDLIVDTFGNVVKVLAVEIHRAWHIAPKALIRAEYINGVGRIALPAVDINSPVDRITGSRSAG
jgi:hypothetical protein